MATALIPVLIGCTPALNWRDVSVEGTRLHALFPCKPQRSTRETLLGGVGVRMDLLACKAGETTFAVSHADIGRTVDASAALEAMRSALVANVGGAETASLSVDVAGVDARRIAVAARRGDREAVEVRAQFFSRDGRLYQASILGRAGVPDAAAETFFGGLRWSAGSP